MILSNLVGAEYFSKIDLESGYHQIMIKEGDKEKTAFSLNGAKFEINRMSFDLKNSGSIFQRAIDDILHPFIGKFTYVYIDYVIIFSETVEEHIEHITKIIESLTEANMKIAPEKSHFYKIKIEFLGHLVSENRITVDPEKIETIENYVLPKTLKQLRNFLVFSGYYRRFIRD